MYREVKEFESPFDLKVRGDFAGALTLYARHYTKALASENEPIADICFDQMFDLCLLEYLKQGGRFETRAKLIADIQEKLRKVLEFNEGDEDGKFKNRLESCRRRLFPRGRSISPFSVDPKWLLKTAQAEE